MVEPLGHSRREDQGGPQAEWRRSLCHVQGGYRCHAGRAAGRCHLDVEVERLGGSDEPDAPRPVVESRFVAMPALAWRDTSDAVFSVPIFEVRSWIVQIGAVRVHLVREGGAFIICNDLGSITEVLDRIDRGTHPTLDIRHSPGCKSRPGPRRQLKSAHCLTAAPPATA